MRLPKWTDGMSRRRRVIDFIGHRLGDGRTGRLNRVGDRFCYIATEVPSGWLG